MEGARREKSRSIEKILEAICELMTRSEKKGREIGVHEKT